MPEEELTSEGEISDVIPPEEMENDTPQNEKESEEPKSSEKRVDVKSLLAQKEHWRKKAEEYQRKASQPTSYDPLESVRIGKLLTNYDDKETDFILEHAKGVNFEAISRAVNNEFIQAGIQSLRGKVADKSKVPSSSPAKSAYTDTKTPEEIEDMDDKTFERYARKMSKDSTGI